MSYRDLSILAKIRPAGSTCMHTHTQTKQKKEKKTEAKPSLSNICLASPINYISTNKYPQQMNDVLLG